mmetsp:Transcript_1251/g.2741  ORF Transcript_1251/g.2741 Transcript_1251/m.2741 type:complete len:217 (+) Transcript_1251:503-1153(+)
MFSYPPVAACSTRSATHRSRTYSVTLSRISIPSASLSGNSGDKRTSKPPNPHPISANRTFTASSPASSRFAKNSGKCARQSTAPGCAGASNCESARGLQCARCLKFFFLGSVVPVLSPLVKLGTCAREPTARPPHHDVSARTTRTHTTHARDARDARATHTRAPLAYLNRRRRPERDHLRRARRHRPSRGGARAHPRTHHTRPPSYPHRTHDVPTL